MHLIEYVLADLLWWIDRLMAELELNCSCAIHFKSEPLSLVKITTRLEQHLVLSGHVLNDPLLAIIDACLHL